MLDLGVKVILGKIVVPKIIQYFSPEILRHFRDCWEQGQTPDLQYLKDNKLYRNRLFASMKYIRKNLFIFLLTLP